MSFQPPRGQFAEVIGGASFAELRSEWLDCFAELELAVCQALHRLDLLDHANRPFSGRLDALADAKANSKLSREGAKTLPGLVSDCKHFLPLRAAIVHGAMQIGLRGSEPVAFFRNAADQARADLRCVVMSASDFEHTKSALKALEGRVRNALNQPLLRRPKQAAADGP